MTKALREDYSRADLGELVRLFVDAGVYLSEWQNTADPAGEATKRDSLVMGAGRELCARGPEGERALLELLDHANAEVRLCAATHVAKFAPERADAALHDLIELGGTIGFYANKVRWHLIPPKS